MKHELRVELDFVDENGTDLHWWLEAEPLDINNPILGSWTRVKNKDGQIMFECSKDEIIQLVKIVEIIDEASRKFLEMEEEKNQ